VLVDLVHSEVLAGVDEAHRVERRKSGRPFVIALGRAADVDDHQRRHHQRQDEEHPGQHRSALDNVLFSDGLDHRRTSRVEWLIGHNSFRLEFVIFGGWG
jgi:hypothetical protein